MTNITNEIFYSINRIRFGKNIPNKIKYIMYLHYEYPLFIFNYNSLKCE